MQWHRRSIRLKGFDYGQRGLYFVTVDLDKRGDIILGNICDDKISLNEYGKVVEKELIRTEKVRKQIKFDIYQIMPDHVHFILNVGVDSIRPKNTKGASIAPVQDCQLGWIIRGIKSAISGRILKMGCSNKLIWQRNYYERIIRNEREYLAIKEYIKNNPKNWRK